MTARIAHRDAAIARVQIQIAVDAFEFKMTIAGREPHGRAARDIEIKVDERVRVACGLAHDVLIEFSDDVDVGAVLVGAQAQRAHLLLCGRALIDRELNFLLVPALHRDVAVKSLHGNARRTCDRKSFRLALDEAQGVCVININSARACRFTRDALRLSPCLLRCARSCGLRKLTLNLSFNLCLALCPLRLTLRALRVELCALRFSAGARRFEHGFACSASRLSVDAGNIVVEVFILIFVFIFILAGLREQTRRVTQRTPICGVANRDTAIDVAELDTRAALSELACEVVPDIIAAPHRQTALSSVMPCGSTASAKDCTGATRTFAT